MTVIVNTIKNIGTNLGKKILSSDDIITAIKNAIIKQDPRIKTGQQYFDELGGTTSVDDVIQNAVINKQNRQATLQEIGSNWKYRKERTMLRNLATQDPDIQDLISSIPEVPAGKELKVSPKVLMKFADIYNKQEPFSAQYLVNTLGKGTFDKLRNRATLIPVEEGGIKPESIAFYSKQRKVDPNTDMVTAKAENILRNYKKLVPEATGYELKPNNLGEVDIDSLLSLDKDVKNYITKNGVINKTNKFALLNKLKNEGVIDELGLGEVFLMGPKTVSSNDPQILNYLAKAKTGKLPKHFKYTQKILTEPQQIQLKNIYKNIAEIYKPMNLGKGMMQGDLLSKKTKELFQNNVNRMIEHGVRRQDKTIDEVMESLVKQTNDPDFYEKVVPLMIKKVQLQDKIDYYKSKGVDLDDVNLSHMTAVVDDIDLTFKLNNIFIGSAKKNKEEQKYANKIRRLKSQLQGRGGIQLVSKNQAKQASDEIDQLEFEIEELGLRRPIEADFELGMDDQFKSTMQQNLEISEQMKDGGFASIEEVLEYDNG
jgi:hypothetical protein